MKNIKTVKLVRLSLIAVFMSIGFTFLSCSPSDELSDDVGIIEEVVEREIYEKPFFMMTGVYFEDGIPNPKYDLVLAQLYVDTDEFIKACEIAMEHTYYSYTFLKRILENKMVGAIDEIPDTPLPKHDNVRGRDSFK